MKNRFVGGMLIFLVIVFGHGAWAQAFSTSDLAGTWYVYLLESNPDDGVYWLYGTFTMDEAGHIAGGSYITPEGTSVAVTGGQVAIDDEGRTSGSYTAEGGMSGMFPSGKLDQNKNILAFVVTGSDGSLDLGLAVKGGGAFVQSDLAGTWHSYMAVSDPVLGKLWLQGTFTVDEAGSITGGSYTAPDDTSVAITGGQVSIDTAGEISGSFDSEMGLSGMIPSGKLDPTKNILPYVTINTQGTMVVGLAVKGGGSFTQSDLSGTWSSYIFEFGSMGDSWIYGDFTMDSLGNLISGTYVIPDGTTIPVTSGDASLDENGGFSVSSSSGGYAKNFPSGKMDRNKSVIALIGLDALGSMDFGISIRNEAVSDAQIQTRLYYPHVASNEKWETEVCVINLSGDAMSGYIRVYDNQGTYLYSRNVSLNGYGRTALIVGNEFSDPENIGYMIVTSNSPDVCGYTKFYREGLYRVAVPAVEEVNTGDIYVPHIASSDRWWTGLALVNTTDTQKTLEIRFSTGEEKEVEMAAGEHLVFNIKSFFGGVSQTDIESAVISGGAGVIGLELFGGKKTLSGVLLKDTAAEVLYFPHVVSSQKWWTGIAALNPNSSNASLTVSPYRETGAALAPFGVDIAAEGKYLGNAAGLSLPEETAWFQIDSSQPLNGFELFGTNNGKQLAGYSAVNIHRQEGVFPKLDHEGWTGVAFVNTSENTANITLGVYDDQGSRIAEKAIALTGYEKVVDNPENIFAGSITGGTYMKFSSNRDVVGFQLNGSSDGMMLDGLPGM